MEIELQNLERKTNLIKEAIVNNMLYFNALNSELRQQMTLSSGNIQTNGRSTPVSILTRLAGSAGLAGLANFFITS